MYIARFLLLFLSLFGLCNLSIAAVVDQQQTSTNLGLAVLNAQQTPLAQEVTAGITGRLMSVDLFLGRGPEVTTGTFIFSIVSTLAGGIQFASVHDMTSIATSGVNTIKFDLGMYGLSVTEGNKFVIELSGPSDYPTERVSGCYAICWWGGLGNPYQAGNAKVGNAIRFTEDFAFVTYVEPSAVPLPAAAWLLLSGAGALGAFARRRKIVAQAA